MNLSTAKIRGGKFKQACNKTVSEMKRLNIPGAAVGIWHKGREQTAGFGITSLENPLPVTPDTLFQTGSISKTFTGTVMMKLVEQGKVSLDVPVRKYIKDLKLRDKEVARSVTVRHLLTHTGGWVGDYFNDFGNGDDALEKMVRDIAKLPQVQPLGKIWSYNNTGFNIASRVIEVVTRQPFETVIQNALFDPLGLKMTFYFPSDEMITHRFVAGHFIEKGKLHVARPWAIGRCNAGVGGVVSNVKDLLAYARFHMGNGNGIIKRRTLEMMRAPQADAGGRGKIGITWFIRGEGEATRYSHGGATNGQKALLVFIPEKNFAFTILTNSEEGGVLINNVSAFILDTYFGIKPFTPKPLQKTTKELKEFAGSYRIGTEAFDLKVKQGHLVIHHIPLGGFPTPETPPGPAMPPVRLGFYTDDNVVGLDEPMKNELGDFIRNENGRIQYLRIGGRAHKKIK